VGKSRIIDFIGCRKARDNFCNGLEVTVSGVAPIYCPQQNADFIIPTENTKQTQMSATKEKASKPAKEKAAKKADTKPKKPRKEVAPTAACTLPYASLVKKKNLLPIEKIF